MLLVILIVVAAVAGAAGLGLYIMMENVDATVDSSGVTLQVAVVGNDLTVSALSYPAGAEITALVLTIDGYTLPPGVAYKDVSMVAGERVVYEDIAMGIQGTRAVSIYAVYANEDTRMVWLDSLKFA